MYSPSEPRKRGFEDQADEQIEFSDPGSKAKRSKPGLECNLEAIPVDNPILRGDLPHAAVMIYDQSPYTNNYNSPPNPTRVINHALQDYQMQLMLLEQQNKKRLLMEERTREGQDAALQAITSLPDHLDITHTSVKALLENLTVYLRNIENFKQSISHDVDTLRADEENLSGKEAEIRALANKYDECIEMTPPAQRIDLELVRDNAMLTMRQALESLRLKKDKSMEKVEGKNERIAKLDEALGRSGEVVPQLIDDLIKLAEKLRQHSYGVIRAIAENDV